MPLCQAHGQLKASEASQGWLCGYASSTLAFLCCMDELLLPTYRMPHLSDAPKLLHVCQVALDIGCRHTGIDPLQCLQAAQILCHVFMCSAQQVGNCSFLIENLLLITDSWQLSYLIGLCAPDGSPQY